MPIKLINADDIQAIHDEIDSVHDANLAELDKVKGIDPPDAILYDKVQRAFLHAYVTMRHEKKIPLMEVEEAVANLCAHLIHTFIGSSLRAELPNSAHKLIAARILTLTTAVLMSDIEDQENHDAKSPVH